MTCNESQKDLTCEPENNFNHYFVYITLIATFWPTPTLPSEGTFGSGKMRLIRVACAK